MAERGLVNSGTDVTGFGLLGHLGAMCRESRVRAEIEAGKVPVLAPEVWRLVAADCVPGGTRDNLKAAEDFTEFARGVTAARKFLLADAQTSGGLLLSIPKRKLNRVLNLLRELRAPCAAVIGCVVSGRPGIAVEP